VKQGEVNSKLQNAVGEGDILECTPKMRHEIKGPITLFAVRADGSRMPHLWILAGVAVLTAGFDCAENVGILRALGASHLSISMAQAICWPSGCKWGLFGLALLLTAWILGQSASLIYFLPTRRLLALAYGTAGILLFICLAIPHVIELAVDMFARAAICRAHRFAAHLPYG